MGSGMHGMALCAGVGGLELGLRLALGDDYRCCVYAERDAYAAATLVARMEDALLDRAPVWDDLTTFDGRAWRGCVDIVAAGFPCQPWSSAGQRQGTDDERWLWPDIARIVREARPGWVFLENSPRLVRGGIEHIQRDLALLGFHAEWDLFSASETGAPHERDRIFILGNADGDGQSGKRRTGDVWADIDGPGGAGNFPPGQNDWDGWGTWLRQYPGTEPALRRGAHGTARRVDRLRVAGNSVVPVVAALAFLHLRDRLMGVTS